MCSFSERIHLAQIFFFKEHNQGMLKNALWTDEVENIKWVFKCIKMRLDLISAPHSC